MKKLYSLFAVAFLAISLSAQTAFTATYDFSEAPSLDNGDFVGTGLTITPFTATGLQSTTTTNRFAWSDAPTASTPDLGKYFEVTLTPATGTTVSVSSITFRSQRSGTGPRNYSVRTNVGGYAANLPASIEPANVELAVQGSNEFFFVTDVSGGQNGSKVTPTTITNISGPVTFRFYFYSAESGSGTFSVDDVVITGTTTSTTLAVSDLSKSKNSFVKNTFVKTNEITFGSEAKDVKVYNMFGQVVKTASVRENESLNVSELQKGNYIVTGTVNNQPVSQKILKD
jgi:hypothetical protein